MIRILCYGDSNTFGVDGRTMADDIFSPRYDEQTRWTFLLQKRLGPDYCIIEEGMSGRTTCLDDPKVYGRNGYTFLDTVSQSHSPLDLIIVMLGTNDLKAHFLDKMSDPCFGIRKIILHLKELLTESMDPFCNPDCKILIVAPPCIHKNKYGTYCYGFTEESEAAGKKLPEVYAKTARENGCYFADANQWCSADSGDGVHLSPKGHSQFAEGIEKVIRSVL